jgi:membrane protease YdiL (CAAX protease family)
MKQRPAPRERGLAAVLGRGDLGASLLAVFPLFLLYEIGVIFTPTMNGVDFVSRNLFALVGYDRTQYLAIHGALALAFLAILWAVRRTRAVRRGTFLPMLLESGIYALTLGTFIVFVMERLLGFEPRLAMAPLTSLVMAIGAGVHEELVFRLGLMAGGAALLKLLGARTAVAVLAASLVSAALFSAVHHLGPLGDPFTAEVFVFRLLAGLVFSAIFYWRSLAHAVYTHALYDVYVMLIRPL